MSGEPTFFTKVREKMQAKGLLARILTREFALEAVVLGAIGGACFAAAFIVSTGVIVRSTDTIALEDLTGRDAGDAAVWLTTQGLVPEVDHFENDDRAAPLTVLFQQPPAGEDLRPGNVVKLVVSRGARTSPIPDVRGTAVSQARLILERNGLAVGEPEEIWDDDAPAGQVIATAPGPNAPVRAGGTVRLLVSKGPAPRVWVVPDVEWSLYDSLADRAASMGVNLEIGQRMHASDEPDGAILEQFPGPGARLAEGESLRVTVNGDVKVPNALGAGADLVPISILVPRGFAARMLTIRLARGAWTRVLYDEPVLPGERVRVVAAVLPGDRAVATLDGRDVFSRTY